ncbi:MAG: helix-turn-helix domain-containing protein [Terriglobales bacterium]
MDAIVKALEKTRYNKTAAAKRLEMSFRALPYRVKSWGSNRTTLATGTGRALRICRGAQWRMLALLAQRCKNMRHGHSSLADLWYFRRARRALH